MEGTSSWYVFSVCELWTQLSTFGLLGLHKSSSCVTGDLGVPHVMLWENPENGWRWGERLGERRWGWEWERNHSTLTALFSWTFQLLLFYSLEVGDHMSWQDRFYNHLAYRALFWNLMILSICFFTHFTSTFCYMSIFLAVWIFLLWIAYFLSLDQICRDFLVCKSSLYKRYCLYVANRYYTII